MRKGVTSKFTPWQVGLALLVGAFLIASAASMLLAAHKGSRVVDVDYYNHGLHYNQTGSGSKNAGIAWQMSCSLAGDQLQVRVLDQSGAAVAGGKLCFEPAPDSAVQVGQITLREKAPGSFCARRPVSPRGELRGTLLFTRGDQTASKKLVLID